jgi:hypothetical protein
MVLTDMLTDVEVFQGSEDRLKKFPTVGGCSPNRLKSRRKGGLAGVSRYRRQTGLLIVLFSPWTALRASLREGLRSLLKRPSPPLDIYIQNIPPYKE